MSFGTLPDLQIAIGQGLGRSLLYSTVVKKFVQRSQRADRAIVSNIFNVTFFVYHFYSYSLPCLWCAFFLFYHFIEDLSQHFFRFFVACFDVFGSDSVATFF